MRSATIRILVVLSLLTSAGIISMQVYWANHAIELRKKEFNRKVNAALQSVSATLSATAPAERVNAGQYLLPVTGAGRNSAQLQQLLTAAFARYNVHVDFEFATYDAHAGKLAYGGMQHMPGAYEHKEEADFPALQKHFSYIGIYFPHLSWYIFTGTYIWLLSALVVVTLMCFLCYLVFRAYRQKQLEEIQKDFVSNVSHEFQTPLSAIKLSAGVLQDPAIADSPQRLQRYAAIIQQEVEKLTGHIEQVLQTHDVDKQKPTLNKTSFEWQEILEDVVNQAARRLECVDGQIALHLPEKPVKFRGDILHLSNAIGNLVDNAIKYCDNTPIIHIFLKNKGKQLYITVRDNGIGIDKQYQKWLFNKFYRVPTGNVHNVKGVGLGLSYVFYIARSHGGTLSCNSKPGAGSAFTLSFPQK